MAGKTSGLVVAKEAIVVTVGAKPPVYHQAEVLDKRRDEKVTVDLTEVEPKDPGDEGIPYAFKAYQKVSKDHPAVKACPGAFMPYDELSDSDLELVTTG